MEVNILQARANLPQRLRRVEAGEEVVICRGREPVALLVRAPKKGKRNIWGDLDCEMAPDFDEPLEDFGPYM